MCNEKLHQYIKKNGITSFSQPKGKLKYKFLDPAAVYKGQLWDWDSFFCGLALIDVYDNTAEYIKGSVLNFFDYIEEDGYIPYMINASEEKQDFTYALPKLNSRIRDKSLNCIKPLLAQMIIIANQKLDDHKWIKEIYPKLNLYIEYWENNQNTKKNLFVWRSYRGSGTDNHPAIYGRPLNSSAGVELNSFMYKEYLAMANISDMCGALDKSLEYKLKAQDLAKSINKNMWDSIDGLYYHLDTLSNKPPLAHQEIDWNVLLKFRTWTCFMPMWAGFAPQEYAERMVKEHLINANEFWSDYGLRTMAKNEILYNTYETSNPSNWQGPIWIVSSYLMFKGLLNYNYKKEAKMVADNIIKCLCSDLDRCGALHEYYNPETGLSSINKGFMNWNALAGIMYNEL